MINLFKKKSAIEIIFEKNELNLIYLYKSVSSLR